MKHTSSSAGSATIRSLLTGQKQALKAKKRVYSVSSATLRMRSITLANGIGWKLSIFFFIMLKICSMSYQNNGFEKKINYFSLFY